jgi:hypothetical protein
MNTENVGPVYTPTESVGPNIVGYRPEQINYLALPTVEQRFLANDQAQRTAGIWNYNSLNYMKNVCSLDPSNPYCEVAYTQGAPGEELVIQAVREKYYTSGSARHITAFDPTRPYYGKVAQPLYTTQTVPKNTNDYFTIDKDPLIVKLLTVSLAGKYRSEQADEIIAELYQDAIARGQSGIANTRFGKVAQYILTKC